MMTLKNEYKPFISSVALPPGSEKFFGRQQELSFIRSHLPKESVLIVGGRQIGKSSFLNQVLVWCRAQADLAPFLVELAEVREGKGFCEALGVAVAEEKLSRRLEGEVTLKKIIGACREEQRLPVFLFNEIDALAGHELLKEWRDLDSRGQARFVMTGHVIVADLGGGEGELDFMVGPNFGGRAIALTVLSHQDSENLLARLTSGESPLRWKDSRQKLRAVQLLIERSYRMPQVLQFFGEQLWKRMESKGRVVVTSHDVEEVLKREGDKVWLEIEGYLEDEKLWPGTSPGDKAAYQLILYCMTRHQWRTSSSAARDRSEGRLPFASTCSFTPDEVKKTVLGTISKILDIEARSCCAGYLEDFNFPRALRLLTLTSALAVDPMGEDRYAFLMDIVPRELEARYRRQDPYLDVLIKETTKKIR